MAIRKAKSSASSSQQAPAVPLSFPIVGVGASAGGFEAFSEMLAALPAETGLAFVLIQHLDPTHESMLAPLLARRSMLPVTQVADGMAVERDRVYVIPPNTSMSIEDGFLKLTVRAARHHKNMPIDEFFQSLAAYRKEAAIGVVLSGTATDGTIGLEAIKAEGGICFAQDEASAQYAGMPASARASGIVDFTLPPAKIAAELLRIARAAPGLPNLIIPQAAGSDDALRDLIVLIRNASGVDFTHYRMSALHRRIARRMRLKRLPDLRAYVEYLRNDPVELDSLYQDILIHVTSFFREPESFQLLQSSIIPTLLAEKSADEALRIWVPGCSSGEEAYSIAIVLSEYVSRRQIQVPIRIFATDINERLIAKARAGIYASSKMAHVSAERLRTVFVKSGDSYRVAQAIRETCTFARHDLTSDPPFSRIDLISCRNLLIYLDPILQEAILAMFHFALNSNGVLLLGKSETPNAVPNLFGSLGRKSKFYGKKPATNSSRLNINSGRFDWGGQQLLPENAASPRARLPPEPAQRNPMVMEEHETTNEELRALNEEFLSNNEELQSTNEELETAKEELQSANEALVSLSEQQASRNAELLRINDDLRNVLDAVQIPILILDKNQRIRRFTPSVGQIFNLLPGDVGRALHDLRSNLQTTELPHLISQAMATLSVQERQVRDLQGRYYSMILRPYRRHDGEVDGVLIVLFDTDELTRSIVETKRARDYARAIVETVREPLVVLDSKLRVATANRSFYSAFRLSFEQVNGQSMFDLDGGVWGKPGLRQLLERVLPHNTQITDFKFNAVFPKTGYRRLMLNARKLQWEGEESEMILLAIEDMTEKELITEALQHSGERLRDLTAGLLTAQEEERKRIARELHDGLNQRLAMLLVELETLERHPPRSTKMVRGRLEAVRSGIESISDDIRQTAHQLHPSTVEHLGLPAAMRSLCADVSKREHIEVHCRERNTQRLVPADISLCLYRVAQEAIHNVVKHSGARQVTISLLIANNRVILLVRDAGFGFDPELAKNNRGLGIVSMGERARLVGGTLSIRSRPGAGTRVALEIPLPEDHS